MLPLHDLQTQLGGGSSHHQSRLVPSASQQRSNARSGGSQRGGLGFLVVGGPAAGPWPVVGRSVAGSSARRAAWCAATAVAAAPTLDGSQHSAAPLVDLGYDRGIEDKYEWGEQVGKGGNGIVRLVTDRTSGEVFACKSIRKALPDASEKKRAGHLESIRCEIEALRRLRGSLNVVKLADVYEDDEAVHVVQEYCRGGELWHRIGERHYSERTVASFMRAVLRTIAQCHSHHLLHRDVKPHNFMLLDEGERAPLKAIDFGLAVPFDPACLPRTDLGLEGTPWYMAPEVLSSQVVPASDLWSAGVMAHQLLTGRLPFDDHRNPYAPSLSAVWKSVLTDEVNLTRPWWNDISDEAKDFVFKLLNRDPSERPSAKEALKHPWLRGNSAERSTGRAIDGSVIQRIQRFGQNNRFKRGVLQMIAEELLAAAAAAPAAGLESPATAGASGSSVDAESPRSPTSSVVIKGPDSTPMRELFARLQFTGEVLEAEQVADSLQRMGYRLQPSEVQRVIEQVDTSGSGKVRRAAFAASQIDWRYLQQAGREEWLRIAAAAFAKLDQDADGVIGSKEILGTLRSKLPEDELRGTIRQAMEEAGMGADAETMDFEGFLQMLRVGSVDSLDQYDARCFGSYGGSLGSLERLGALLASYDSSQHGSSSSADNSRHGVGSDGARRRTNAAAAAAAVAAAAEAASGVNQSPKPWAKQQVSFNFDFGVPKSAARPIWPSAAHQETLGGPQHFAGPAAADAVATAAAEAAKVSQQAADAGVAAGSSYFNTGAVRGGLQFDKRMHGASLYRNAVVQGGAGPAQTGTLKQLLCK